METPQEKAQQILDIIKKEPKTYTYREVGEMVGLTDEQVRGVARRLQATGLFRKTPGVAGGKIGSSSLQLTEAEMAKMTTEEVSALVLQETKTDTEKQKRLIAERKLSVLKLDYRNLEKRFDALTGYQEMERIPVHIKPVKGGPPNEISPVIVFSDWHAEEKVDKRLLGGKNQYNLKIAEGRAATVARNAVKRMNELSDEGTINSVGVFLLGDFITGHIHDENVENALLGQSDALLFVEELLFAALCHLLDNTPYHYTMYCKVGNHSRMTKKVRASTEWQNSVEPWMYWSLSRRIKEKYGERVRFHMEESYYSVVNILGTKVRFHHGHAVSYGGGVGGLHIPLRKKIKNWNETEKVDLDIMGHYHSFLEHSTFKYMVNGSLIGYNAYADRLGVPMEPPLQGMAVIHKKHGVVRLLPLLAE